MAEAVKLFTLEKLNNAFSPIDGQGGNLFELDGTNYTDLGNSSMFAVHEVERVRYCELFKKWLIWDGKRWRVDQQKEILTVAKGFLRTLVTYANKTDDDELRQQRLRHCIRSERSQAIASFLYLAGAELGVLPEDLDRDPWLLNLNNGTLDLKTCTLKKHDRGDNITKISPIDYDQDAVCPRWLAFLDRVMNGNEKMIDFLQRAVGWSLTGDISQHIIFIPFGTGANGKSTFLNTIRAVMGEYAQQIPTETLMVKKYGTVPSDVARLRGARFVTAIEAQEGADLNESLVKQITGGDPVTARALYSEWVEFQPQCKIWLATNHKPVIKGTDHAIWRRIRLIPFDVQIPEAEQDKELPEKLKEELPGILEWARRGLINWLLVRLKSTPEIEAATMNYQKSMDTLGGFLEDCCIKDKIAQETNKALFGRYKKWREENQESTVTQSEFTAKMEERGFDSMRDRKGKNWIGIRLKDDEIIF